MRFLVGLALGAVVVAGLPVEARADDVSTDLDRVVQRLGEEAAYFDPGAIAGISVRRLDTGEESAYQGDRWLKSASSLKMTWVAAAIRESGYDAVEPHMNGIWVLSDNKVGGRVIGLAGGLDPINRLTAGLGMLGTEVVEWTFGSVEYRSSSYPGAHPALNYTSTDDLVTFWRLLYEGWVLSPTETAAVLEWARAARHRGYPSGLLTRLPEDQWDSVAFKMGWLPPGRTEEDEETGEIIEVDDLDTLVGSGVVEVPGGPTYIVAIGSFGGTSWPGKVQWVSYSACRIYETITATGLECDRSGDPSRTRFDRDPPIGGLDRVWGGGEFVSVQGWAMDPDDPIASIRVRFTIDGVPTGSDRASDRTSWGGGPMTVGPGHGFTDVLLSGLDPGDHRVCALAVNDGSGLSTEIGCLTHRVVGSWTPSPTARLPSPRTLRGSD